MNKNVAIIIALLARRYEHAALIPVSLVASSLFFSAITLLVGRPRPLMESARIVQGGFSFPSGHAAVSATFYGTIAYVLIREVRSEVDPKANGATRVLSDTQEESPRRNRSHRPGNRGRGAS